MTTTKPPAAKRRRKPPAHQPSQEHDPSYKRFFSNPRMVRDLLRGFLPGPWLETLDLASLRPVPGNLVGRRNRQRHSDVIWRLRSKRGGKWVYLCLLIEFQSRPYKFMAVRILTYLGLFYEALIRHRPGLLKKGVLLPAVIPIVVYGKPRWVWPLKLSELIEPWPEKLADLQPECSFRLVDEGRYPDEELRALAW